MAAKTYRKTALVTAEQFLPAIGQIPKGVYSSGPGDPRKKLDCDWVLDTKEGRHTLRGGDYICTGPAGEQWNVAQEIFEATYEEALSTPNPGDAEVERLRAALADSCWTASVFHKPFASRRGKERMPTIHSIKGTFATEQEALAKANEVIAQGRPSIDTFIDRETAEPIATFHISSDGMKELGKIATRLSAAMEGRTDA